ncbi:MAG: hypothetical protein ACO1TE_02340 [Prosthecobacter sp.]
MRPFALALIFVTSLLSVPASRAQVTEPAQDKAKAAAEKPPGAETSVAPGWKILRFSMSSEGAQVTVKETADGESIVLKSAATDGDRLLSATFTADELRVEAQINGTRHSLSQKTADLNKSPNKRSTSGPTDQDRKNYESLSEKGREQFRNELRSHFSDEKFRNAPEEERRAVIKAIFDKVAKQAAPSGPAAKTSDLDEKAGRTAPAIEGAQARNEEERKKFEALSEKARAKFRDAVREKFSDETFRNASEEERRNAVRAIFEKIEKEDQEGR